MFRRWQIGADGNGLDDRLFPENLERFADRPEQLCLAKHDAVRKSWAKPEKMTDQTNAPDIAPSKDQSVAQSKPVAAFGPECGLEAAKAFVPCL